MCSFFTTKPQRVYHSVKLKKNIFRLINRLVFNYEYSNAHRTSPIECGDDVVIAAGILVSSGTMIYKIV